MRTKRTPLLLAIAIALFTLLGIQPAQAQVPQPFVSLEFPMLEPSVIAGQTLEMTVHLDAAEPTKFNSQAFESSCAGVTGLPSGYATDPIQSQSQTVSMWFPENLDGQPCTISATFTNYGQTHAVTYQQVSATIYVQPRAGGQVEIIDTTHEILGGESRRFKAAVSSLVGPMVFKNALVNIDCGPIYGDDFRLPGEPLLSLETFEYHFDVMLPDVAERTLCLFNGSFETDQGFFLLTQSTIHVSPRPVDPDQNTIHLPLVIAP